MIQRKIRGKINTDRRKAILTGALKDVLEKDKEVLFAYLYGSSARFSTYPGGDIDVAVYLKPTNLKRYLEKEEELTFVLTKKIHNDKIDLRILNISPLQLQYNAMKEGILIFIRDDSQRAEFETMVMNRFFQLKPYFDEYTRMLSLRIKGSSK